ncbi:MAG TPA: glycosyltransferase family 2 protein [Phycisphaerae bacterium]|jgi:dolichol-phosphate mannosyltransferase|nr:glycosyltransferase family 2 protein [Phycisphaerae bacterium]HQL54475.1 glycosyltransferase family 2 protein [Phycisphaerae bacterium]
MRFLVAIPVYNEERYLPGVLTAVRRYTSDILVVDDGSTDATPALLRLEPGVRVITHRENRGYGRSLIDAFAFADRHRYDWVITIDCDEQHEPAQIPEFIAQAGAGGADIISGSRYLQARPDDDAAPPDRQQINFTINRVLRQVLGLALTDSFCGFKAHRVAALRRLRLDEPGYAFPLQFWVQCARAGLRIRELPVRRIYRDQSREFGGTLDDPAARLQHYLTVFVRELGRAGAQCPCRIGLPWHADTLAVCRLPQYD